MSNPENLQRDASEVVADSYVQIAKYVAKTRAYPSLLDGLKTVYRRMLFASKDIKTKVKANVITAETQKYHSHGDAYGVLVAMTCKFGILPLYTGYGNFGGGGFSASASRYVSAVLNDVGRLLYLELVDSADYEEGDAGLMEPVYLPALIPYALITGDRGMTVGLPTPEIPSFNLMELVNYCKNRLQGISCDYPKPDFGNCILNCTRDDLAPLYENGYGTIWFKTKFEVIGNSIVVSDLPPKSRHWKSHPKIQQHLDSGAIDFYEDSTESGSKYTYVVRDESQITIQQLCDIFEKYAYSKVTYRMYFERDGSVYLCPFSYIIDESQKYLKVCASRKFKKEEETLKWRLEIFDAISKLRASDELKYISKKSGKFFKDLIKSWGFSDDVASAVMSKSISYLTVDHDNEIQNLRDQLLEVQNLALDPTKYLLGLYDKFSEMVASLYSSRKHSQFKDEVDDLSRIGYKFDKSSGIIEFLHTDRRKKIYPSNGMMFELKADGSLRCRFVSKELGLKVETDADFVTSSCENVKFVIVTMGDRMTVVPAEKITSNYWKFMKLWDGYFVDGIFLVNNLKSIIVGDSGNSKEVDLRDWVKSRTSYPQKVLKCGRIIEVKEV